MILLKTKYPLAVTSKINRRGLEVSVKRLIFRFKGTISLMPGTSSDPAFRRVDVDVNTGKVMGLF
jgi:formyltetrahydrofolate synthetase